METEINYQGYEVLKQKGRHGRHILYHVLVAEKALGKPMPKGAIVHHMNEIKHDNRPSNLVICPDRAYHHLLHQRMRAKQACGKAWYLKCCYCKEYDAAENLRAEGSTGYCHPPCKLIYNKAYQAMNKKKVKAQRDQYYKKNRDIITTKERERYARRKSKRN